MRGLWRTNWHSNSGLPQYFSYPCQYHSINVPFSSISLYITLLPEGHTTEGHCSAKGSIFFSRKSGNTEHKIFSHFPYMKCQAAVEGYACCLTIGFCCDLIQYMIYLLTAIGLTSGGSSTVHIYTQTVHITTQITTEQHK